MLLPTLLALAAPLTRRAALSGAAAGSLALRPRALAAAPSTKVIGGVTTDGLVDFSVSVPAGFFVTSAAKRIAGDTVRRNGVVLSALDFSSGLSVAVAESSAAELLGALGDFEAAKASSKFAFAAFSDIARPRLVAGLLMRQHDGALKAPDRPIASELVGGVDAAGPKLAFEIATITRAAGTGQGGFDRRAAASASSWVAGTGEAAASDDAIGRASAAAGTAPEERRATRARAVLLPPRERADVGRILVLWVSSPGGWPQTDDLDKVLDSFAVAPKYDPFEAAGAKPVAAAM